MAYNEQIRNEISADETGNSTKILLTAAATYTGAWEEVTNYTTVAVAIIGSLATDGTLYIEASQDGGTVVRSESFPVANATSDKPHIWNVVETHIRIRYTNGTTPQTGTFQLQTKYSNNQELGLLNSAGDTINADTALQIVKSVGTGTDPNEAYQNERLSGVDADNSSTATLGAAATFTGSFTDIAGYHGISVLIDGTSGGTSDGTLFMEFSHDGISTNRSIVINVDDVSSTPPRTLGTVAKYFRVRYTNGTTPQTSFDIQTMFHTEQVRLVSRLDGNLSNDNDVQDVRAVIAGQNSAGNFRNIPIDLDNNLSVGIGEPSTAFGDLRTTELTPQVQITFPYNINTDQVETTTANGGTVTQAASMAIIQTSTNSAGAADVCTLRSLKYRAGLGGLARFSCLFSAGVASSTQTIGAGDDEDGFFFGYNGSAFGSLIRRDSSDTWTAQTAWNIDTLDGSSDDDNPSGITLDPTKLNVFAVEFQWGSGQILFCVENPGTGKFMKVHRISYANTNTQVSLLNPNFPICGEVVNSGNTSNLTMKIDSMAAFVEGKDVKTGPLNSIEETKNSSASEIAIITLRNKSTYASATNRVIVDLKTLSVGNDVNQLAIFKLWEDATLGGSPSYTDINATNSVIEYDVAGTTIASGRLVATYVCPKDNGLLIDLTKIELDIRPGHTITVGALSAGGAADHVAAFTWREDF